MSKKGRPTIYSNDVAFQICDRLSDGEPLKRICTDPTMPAKTTVYRWRHENAEFRDMYARAREDQADTFADDIVDIADSEEDPNRARVRIDARKWVAAKLKERAYGDRVKVDGNHKVTNEPGAISNTAAFIAGVFGSGQTDASSKPRLH